MPKTLRFICYGITSILSMATLCFASYAVYFQIFAKMANREATGTLLIPYWPFYIFELIAFVLLAIVLLCDAIKAVAAIFDDDFAKEVMSTWVC
jgi:TRAP-type mannitol/chloroaromatic compound transport system permease small subunit